MDHGAICGTEHVPGVADGVVWFVTRRKWKMKMMNGPIFGCGVSLL